MEQSKSAPANPTTPKIVLALAELPAKALVDERALAAALAVTQRTVRRMVARFELPPPILLAGRSTWIADRVLAHLEARAARAARRAEQEERRIAAIGIAPVSQKREGIQSGAAEEIR